MAEAQGIIVEIIGGLIRRRGGDVPEITPESVIGTDLELDSLELAELSAALEDRMGKDPYSEGLVPATVGELAGFYN